MKTREDVEVIKLIKGLKRRSFSLGEGDGACLPVGRDEAE